MKKLTKYDIADLVLFYVAMTFFLTLVGSIVAVGSTFGMKDNEYVNRNPMIVIHLFYFSALCVINYILFFKRPVLIRLIFPRSGESEVELTGGLMLLTQYGFWIRLLAIMTLLDSFIQFVSHFATELVNARPFRINSFASMQTVTDCISFLLALLVLWKADWIAEKVKSIGSGGQTPKVDGSPSQAT